MDVGNVNQTSVSAVVDSSQWPPGVARRVPLRIRDSYCEPVRTAFHDQLDALTQTLGQMCGLAGLAMERATQALLQADLVLADQVITDHDQLVLMRTKAEDDALILLALQAPVAGDLRTVVGSIQNVADAERMGALALHVAKIARRRHPGRTLPEEVIGYFAEMGRIAVQLGHSAKDVVLTGDPYPAAQIRHEDDAMDELHRHLFTVLMDRNWEHGVAAAVDITLLGRFYERFADHAVEIGRRVVFQATGRPLDK
jgi:phosphate transport system protein